jgi:phospholipid/cholesterol/gamma-HCH transport system substrate-binding protein
MATTAVSLENLQAVTLEVRRLVESGDIQDRTVALLDSLNTAVQSGQKLVEELNAMATDPAMRNSLESTLSNVEKMSESGTRIAANAEVMAENGVVVSDEAVKLSRKANELAIQVEDLIKTFKETLNRFTGGSSAVFGGGVELSADVVRETDPARIRTDLNVSLPVGDEKLVFGLYDAFESNKLNLQFSRNMNELVALRYGVYASKPGVGVDYALAPRLNLRSDLFGLNEPQLDLRLGYRIDSRFNAWFGVERIFQRPMAAFGFGIKR